MIAFKPNEKTEQIRKNVRGIGDNNLISFCDNNVDSAETYLERPRSFRPGAPPSADNSVYIEWKPVYR